MLDRGVWYIMIDKIKALLEIEGLPLTVMLGVSILGLIITLA